MSVEQCTPLRETLESELSALRRRIREIERDLHRLSFPGSIARARRTGLPVEVEFIGDFDVVRAQGVNISKTGICFEVCDALPFEMRFSHAGTYQCYRAHLAWMKRLPDGGQRFGFAFAEKSGREKEHLPAGGI